MQTFYECLPCFVNQALGVCRRCSATDNQIENVMRAVFGALAAIDYNDAPPCTAKTIYRILYGELGIRDPYASEKVRFNVFAERILPGVWKKYAAERDAFSARVRLSIAANIIDFGKKTQLTEEEVLENFDRVMAMPVDVEALKRLKNSVADAETILFLCDNAGEIVFDRFLIEEMPFKKITCAVRGEPVINDATLDDARAIGLTDLVPVIGNGSDVPGTILEECSQEFRHYFDAADLVIAKGQGNFETLSGIKDKKIFYLLQVKCPLVARDIGYPVGSPAIVESADDFFCGTGSADNNGNVHVQGGVC